MAPIATIRVNTAKLDLLTGSLRPRANFLLDKAAFDIEANAKPRTAYDTGALRSSLYVSGASGGGDYSQAASDAIAKAASGGKQTAPRTINVMPEVKPRGDMQRVIGASVEYATFQEFYQPFLLPAVENERPMFVEAWRLLFL